MLTKTWHEPCLENRFVNSVYAQNLIVDGQILVDSNKYLYKVFEPLKIEEKIEILNVPLTKSVKIR